MDPEGLLMNEARIVIVNGSPRKHWNTGRMCESFAEGARSCQVAASIVHLYDLDYKGCRSCFACKLKNGPHFGTCGFRDGLTPVLKDIAQAEGLVLASPIYFGGLTAGMPPSRNGSSSPSSSTMPNSPLLSPGA